MDPNEKKDALLHWRKANSELQSEEEFNLMLKVEHRKEKEALEQLECRVRDADVRWRDLKHENEDSSSYVRRLYSKIEDESDSLLDVVKRTELQRARNMAIEKDLNEQKPSIERLKCEISGNLNALESHVAEWRTWEDRRMEEASLHLEIHEHSPRLL